MDGFFHSETRISGKNLKKQTNKRKHNNKKTKRFLLPFRYFQMPFWYICHLQSLSEQAESSLLFPDHSTSPRSEFKSPRIKWKEPIRSLSVCPECFPHSVYPTSRKRACPVHYMLHPKCKAKKPFQTCTCGRKHLGVAVGTQYSEALLKN